MTLARRIFSRFRIRARNREIVDAIYAGIVERSRTPVLYLECGIPDTVMGRFESLCIHTFLFLRRCRDDAQVKPLAQDVVDRFISDVEDSIREIGVGDVAVPKRMRRLAGIFFERIAAYDEPLARGDAAGLAEALSVRALKDSLAGGGDPARLAAYMIDTKAELDAVGLDDILAGRVFGEGR